MKNTTSFKFYYLITLSSLSLVLLFSLVDAKPAKRFSLCELSEGRTKCSLSELSLSTTDYHFTPIANNVDVDSIVAVEVVNSVVPIIGTDICEMFNMLTELKLNGIELEGFEEDALRGCENLVEINLSNNKLTTLSASLFMANWRLEKINLQGNQLDETCLKAMSSLNEVTYIDLAKNNLTSFPVEDIKLLSQLQRVLLSSNQLADLDTTKMIQYFPVLNEIYLNDNDFGCLRLKEILEQFEAAQVHVNNDYDYLRDREYRVEHQNGFMCLSDTMVSLITSRSRLPQLEQELSVIKQNLTEVNQLIPIIFEQLNNISAQLINQNLTINKLLEQNKPTESTVSKHIAGPEKNFGLPASVTTTIRPISTRLSRRSTTTQRSVTNSISGTTYKSAFLNDFMRRTISSSTTLPSVKKSEPVQKNWVDEIKALIQPNNQPSQPSGEKEDYEEYFE